MSQKDAKNPVREVRAALSFAMFYPRVAAICLQPGDAAVTQALWDERKRVSRDEKPAVKARLPDLVSGWTDGTAYIVRENAGRIIGLVAQQLINNELIPYQIGIDWFHVSGFTADRLTAVNEAIAGLGVGELSVERYL